MKENGVLSERVCNVLKWVGLIAIPAFATLVGAVGSAVGWADTGIAVAIITAVGTFLGALLKKSEKGTSENGND